MQTLPKNLAGSIACRVSRWPVVKNQGIDLSGFCNKDVATEFTWTDICSCSICIYHIHVAHEFTRPDKPMAFILSYKTAE